MSSLHIAPFLLLAAQQRNAFIPDDQIAWQRSLADARTLAADEGRPLLVVVNLDGESASDRIVPERYQDPEFVAWTRRFVCVVGHPFRHEPRDYDDAGNRIACPRLGVVTCGEHVRLEPELYDAYLGGERISPRHALILPDGTRAFDLFLLFDLRVLDQALARAAEGAPPDASWMPWFEVHGESRALDDALVGARHSWRRSVAEENLRRALDRDVALDLARAMARVGDAGSVETARLLVLARPDDAELGQLLLDAARARGFEADLARMLRATLDGAGPHPGNPTFGCERTLLPLLAQAAPADAPQRTFLAAVLTAAPAADRAAAHAALAAIDAALLAEVEAVIAAEGGPVAVEDLVRFGLAIADGPDVRATIPADPPASAEEVLTELEAADRALAVNEDDPRAAWRFARANLRLALARMAESGPGIGLALQDAERWFARAAERLPDDDLLALDRARTAFWCSKFDEQSQLGREVLARAARRAARRAESHPAARDAADRIATWGSGDPAARTEVERAASLAYDDVAHEALRWIGDAEGRRVAEVVSDPVRAAQSLARGARALARACASRRANDVDHQSLASLLAAHGLTRPALHVARAGLVRFPESNVLRELLRALLDRAGRPEVLCETADWIAALRPDSAASAWYAGHARFLWAEWARRAGRAEGAIAQYDAATERFARSVELEPAYADSAGHYLAMAEMGRGFAHRIAGRRQDAADALVRALARRPVVGDARDALDREALDLVDAVLEWTEIDGESRVNAVAFADALSRAVPGEARWLRAVSDTCLREGLRADGRMGTTVPVPTEMRAEGQPAELRTPCAGGDRWLGLSIEIAARARAVSDDPDSRRYEAQARAVHAERLLVTGRDSEAEKLLEEAARLLDEPARPEETLHGLARRLRTRLGDARPVARPGR